MKYEEALRIAQGRPSPDSWFIEACTAVATAAEASGDFKVEALVSRGIGHGMGQRHSEALGDFDEAIRRNPNFDRAYVNRATAYSILRENRKALSDFDRAIELNPTNAIAYFGRAQVYRRLKMLDKAIADVAMASALDEQNPHFARMWEELLDESQAAGSR